jgi:5-methyltetrahydrofolate--homocysteine methyltransferase
MDLTHEIAEAVLVGDDSRTCQLVSQALSSGLRAGQILHEGLLAGMEEVGRRFRDGVYFLPEVLVAADALKAGMALLQPHLVAENVRPEKTAVIGTVAGDLHDIGKNLVGIMLQGAGFEVIDLGVDVPAERFVEVCRERSVSVVGLSALLTTTMPAMEATVRRLRAELTRPPKILVGGAPVTQEYADRIGADGYGPDAASGAELARRLCFCGTAA